MSANADDFDSPWQLAVMRYWPEFVHFYFPAVYAQIDWSAPCDFLDQELEHIVRDASFGRRRVDKLVRVSGREGAAEMVYVHIELQTRHDRNFAERLWVYHYRLFERFRTPLASLAILSDGSRHWRPCAVITAAHVLTQRTHGKTVLRMAHKRELAANVHGRNWDRQRILDVMHVIDLLMRLPRDLESELRHEIHTKIDRRRIMLPLTSLDRVERKRGRQEGLQEGLQRGLQQGLEQGVQQGMQQGMQQGRLEGMRTVIEGQLARRFGVLDSRTRRKLDRLSEMDLQRLSDRIVTASAGTVGELLKGD